MSDSLIYLIEDLVSYLLSTYNCCICLKPPSPKVALSCPKCDLIYCLQCEEGSQLNTKCKSDHQILTMVNEREQKLIRKLGDIVGEEERKCDMLQKDLM